jgi:hypothetical protein
MSDDFYSFYGSSQKTEEPKAEPEVKKSSNVQARKITNAPSASVPTPAVPAGPLAQPDPRQIDQGALAQQAQAGLTQAGPPKAPSAIDAMSATGKDLLPYAIGAGGAVALSKLWDKFGKGGGDGGGPSTPSGPTTKELIEAEKLKQAQIKTAREQLLHENFVAKNTLTESEQLFGRKAKDATELRLMDKAYEQQKSPVVGANAPATNAPVTAAPAMAPATNPAPVVPTAAPQSQFDLNQLGQSKDPLAGKGWQQPVAPANVVATAETPQAVDETVAKQEEKKPVKKKSEVATFKTAKDIPEGYVFRPDVGNLDRSMYNLLGPEHRQYAKELLTGGQMFGHSSNHNPDFSKLSTEYFQKLQQEIPETILSRDARRAQNIPSKFGNYGSIGFGKAAKVAGVAGTLFAAADVVNAKTPEQRATAGTNLLGAVLPPGADILEAGAPTLGEKQKKAFENAQKLGSPYRSVPPR